MSGHVMLAAVALGTAAAYLSPSHTSRSLDGGMDSLDVPSPLPSPPLGWSTWTTFECNIDATLVTESIHALAASPLFAAGYKWILIDDCWTTCSRWNADHTECRESGERGPDGRIVVSEEKFPDGFAPLTSLAHSLGLKMGIYTSFSATTCAGFTGSWQHEAVDAQAFADWGFDLVKHDTCGTDYSVHDGGLQGAAMRMRDGLWDAGNGTMVYYVDSGNPTSPQRVYNPYQRHVTDKEALLKLATRPSELVWRWATEWENDPLPKGPHMFKSWFDSEDTWGNMLSLLHNQVRIAEYQRCGQLNNPDMLTVGMGGQSFEQYRAQFFLWAVLGAPLLLGNDIREMTQDIIELVTSPEVLAVNQDSDCIQASMARALAATETWIKPLSDGSFAVVLLNKGSSPANCTLFLDDADQGWGAGSDFFPIDFDAVEVRDIYQGKDLGESVHTFQHLVGPQDAAIFVITPK